MLTKDITGQVTGTIFLFACQTVVHSCTGETLFLLLYGRDAKLSTVLNFYLHFQKKPIIYFECGTQFSLRTETHTYEIARKIIQQAKSFWMKQCNKSTHPVAIQVGDAAMINEQPKFRLD